MRLSKLEFMPNDNDDDEDVETEISGFSSSSGETQRYMEDLVEKQNDLNQEGIIWKEYLKTAIMLIVIYFILDGIYLPLE